ncbi:hypothetical protein ACGFJ5_13140 [Micromonospora echinaurantiaca]|uniref:hypothetical protein n=1 Tax=Micromonospora echinaurantiaca TaxID=47857 RepID=UPI003713CEFE
MIHSREATPMDSILAPRTVFTSALRRALRPRALMSAAALVLLPVAAAGCGAPAPTTAANPPADTATTEAVAVTVAAADQGGAGGSATARPRPSAPSGGASQLSWPQLTWHSAQAYGTDGAPARIWRSTADGRWELVREGRPGDRVAAGEVVASPDGRRAAWRSTNPHRLMISAFEGGSAVSVPIAGTLSCTPRWMDNLTVVYTEGNERDWTVVGVRADGKGRHVIATHQRSCPVVANGMVGFVEDRSLRLGDSSGAFRTVQPRIPGDLKIHSLAGFSLDGRHVVVSTHVPSPGECGCGWRIRNYRVDVNTGAATELTPLDPAWTKATGHGAIKQVRFLPGGTLVAQVDTGTYGDDAPAYRLVRYAADGRVLGSLKVPAGTPWGHLL